jgi:hypothetical protein
MTVCAARVTQRAFDEAAPDAMSLTLRYNI